MNDDQLIGRIRAALDEVAEREPGTARVGAGPGAHRPRAWMGVAAATVVLVGGAVWALTRRAADTSDGAAPVTSIGVPVTPITPITPVTPVTPTTPVVDASTSVPVSSPVADTEWFVLASPDLVPGQVDVTRCCIEWPAPGPGHVAAWAITIDGELHGLLMLEAQPPQSGSPASTTTSAADLRSHSILVQPDGWTWTFTSYGLTSTERDDLASQVVAGSGVRFVLPTDGAVHAVRLGEGEAEDGDLITQEYSGVKGIVSISVGDYRGEYAEAAGASDVRPVSVRGAAALQITTDICTLIIWSTPDQQTATLRITAAYADRVDGLIAALVPAAEPG